MKRNSFLTLGAAIAVTMGLASCSNDINDLGKGGIPNGPLSAVVAPDAVVWSGNQTFGNTFTGQYSVGTRDSGSSGSFERWQGDRDWDLPEEIFEAEKNYVFKYLQENPSKIYKNLNLDTYIIQMVGGAKNQYVSDDVDSNGSSHTVENATTQMKQIEIDGFFTQYNEGKDMNGEQPILLKNVKAQNATYQDTYGSTMSDCHAFYFITFPDDTETYGYMAGNTGLYLCFDFQTYKESEGWGVSRNYIYDDYVIKLSPKNGGFFNEAELMPDDKGKCPGCDHPESECDDQCNCGCQDQGSSGNNGNGTQTPGGTNKYQNNEVEINLSLNDIHTLPNGSQKYDIADLVSKLSIHVRYPKNVEVILPVPEALYCNQDDLYILNDHYEGNFNYGSDPNNGEHQFNGEEHVLTYNVGGNEVKLIITYVAAKDDEINNPNVFYQGIKYGGYISVKTEGIDENVIKYCQDNFGDGINFEVYNYYNRGNVNTIGNYSEVSFKELQFTFLSRSFVNFDWETPLAAEKVYPNFYINAFNKTKEGNPYYGDCYVWIKDDSHAKMNTKNGIYLPQANSSKLYDGTEINWVNYNNRNDMNVQLNHFYLPYQGYHKNGSPFNWIYSSKNVAGAIDSGDMLTEYDSFWPFSFGKTPTSENSLQYFRIGEGENYWYYEFDETGNFLVPGNPFKKAL